LRGGCGGRSPLGRRRLPEPDEEITVVHRERLREELRPSEPRGARQQRIVARLEDLPERHLLERRGHEILVELEAGRRDLPLILDETERDPPEAVRKGGDAHHGRLDTKRAEHRCPSPRHLAEVDLDVREKDPDQGSINGCRGGLVVETAELEARYGRNSDLELDALLVDLAQAGDQGVYGVALEQLAEIPRGCATRARLVGQNPSSDLVDERLRNPEKGAGRSGSAVVQRPGPDAPRRRTHVRGGQSDEERAAARVHRFREEGEAASRFAVALRGDLPPLRQQPLLLFQSSRALSRARENRLVDFAERTTEIGLSHPPQEPPRKDGVAAACRLDETQSIFHVGDVDARRNEA